MLWSAPSRALSNNIRVGHRCFSSAAAAARQNAAPPEASAKQVGLYRSGFDDIFFNLSVEHELSNQRPAKNLLFLWQNAPTITIGRHQNPWVECNLAEMEKDGVSLARRHSGGGAVFQDPGCLTFTFLTENKDVDSNFNVLIRALSRSGYEGVERSGRNDMIIRESESIVYKISGSAFKMTKNMFLHHGTLLFNTDFQALGRYLTPNKLKLASKGIQSVKSRVKNLSEVVPSVTVETLRQNLELEFSRAYGAEEVVRDDAELLTLESPGLVSTPSFQTFHTNLRDWNFRFGSTPNFSHQIEPMRLEKWGLFECHLQIAVNQARSSATISKAVIFSDCLYPEAVTKMTDGILCPGDGNVVEYTEDSIRQKTAEYLKANEASLKPEEKGIIEDVMPWIAAQCTGEE